MSIPPVPPVGAAPVAARPQPAPAAGFGDALQRGVAQVSAAEQHVDAVTQSLATGGGAEIHDLMIATTKASVGVDMLVAVRNRAVEAYQEIMRLQV